MTEIKLPITLTAAAVSLAKEASKVIIEAKSYTISNAAQYQNSVELLKRIKGVASKLDAERISQKAPILQAGRDVDALYKADIESLNQAERVLKAAAVKYDQEQRRAVAALQEKLRIEAETKARKEREKLEARAAKAEEKGQDEKAESLRDAAEQVQAFVPVVATIQPKMAGVSTRVNWTYRIVDVNALPREYMIPNEAMLTALAKSTKGSIPVAGVEFYSEDVLAVSNR